MAVKEAEEEEEVSFLWSAIIQCTWRGVAVKFTATPISVHAEWCRMAECSPLLVSEVQRGLRENGVVSYIRSKVWRELAAAEEVPDDNAGMEAFVKKLMHASC